MLAMAETRTEITLLRGEIVKRNGVLVENGVAAPTARVSRRIFQKAPCRCINAPAHTTPSHSHLVIAFPKATRNCFPTRARKNIYFATQL